MDDVHQEDGDDDKDQEGQPEKDETRISKDHKFVFREFERVSGGYRVLMRMLSPFPSFIPWISINMPFVVTI